MSALLSVEDLEIRLGAARPVQRVSFALDPGQALGLVGESGSGKSLTALAVLGLLPASAQISGRVMFDGRDLLSLPTTERSRLRGAQIALVPQDPMTALNPHLSIGRQMTEVLEVHRGASRTQARAEALRMLDAVQIADAGAVLSRYPHQLSGGQRQRVLIATALLCRPRVLIADEPTTALDVTVQAQILRQFSQLQRDFDLALWLISHDLGVVAEVCPRIVVMREGCVVEQGATPQVLERPTHAHTRALIEARPRLTGERPTRLKAAQA